MGRQHTIRPIFSKKCLKMKKFLTQRRGMSLTLLDPPLQNHVQKCHLLNIWLIFLSLNLLKQSGAPFLNFNNSIHLYSLKSKVNNTKIVDTKKQKWNCHGLPLFSPKNSHFMFFLSSDTGTSEFRTWLVPMITCVTSPLVVSFLFQRTTRGDQSSLRSGLYKTSITYLWLPTKR